ncbi:MAG: helix-turn-helix transcriptional regulator [Bacteroidales bacterium]|nr:helix-turn-helix transcriptional regulator [Bacteroidales bacterium]
MKTTDISLREMASEVSPVIKQEVALTMGLSDRLEELMVAKGISKIELARALGKRPNEITRWLSGQHNFTLRTIALLSTFFGESLITITH